ncbi:hypothetical protein L202_01153 [Cryptococcus amylolentus CBS 6039]|uniref:Mitochondrial outer membrane protein OM14 C-terminal domain-containing protein n=2 Tax=Cryptococcus amylolentus TaxID=104669 RepID=A0A1E3I506_9TREE|nr:hypothetical protein L202_01153 [Cryptococcus amylolentus CBS 6039]ODN82896.1 hypothetical protein L202_01153 [Cryptococcus amylolentus CBS 6039]ODO10546.1 hypothetical protein I350_01143 [Cryptococcus amylolentus CBS 6273]
MSYASVAGHNVPFGEMPQPDPNLAEGSTATDEAPAPVAPSEPPLSVELHPPPEPEPSVSDVAPKPVSPPPKSSVHLPESGAQWEKQQDIKKEQQELKKKGKALKKEAKDEFEQAENALAPYWEKTKDVVLRPGTLGGLLGVVNVGILGTAGYFAYTRKNQPWDQRLVGGAVAGTLALFGAEGYLADSYLSTPEGQAEADRAKAEGSKLYLHAKEVILRPQVAGGLVGAVNVAILGAVSYFSYQNWNRPWDRQIVGGVAAGLVALSGLEGWAGKKYKDEQL